MSAADLCSEDTQVLNISGNINCGEDFSSGSLYEKPTQKINMSEYLFESAGLEKKYRPKEAAPKNKYLICLGQLDSNDKIVKYFCLHKFFLKQIEEKTGGFETEKNVNEIIKEAEIFFYKTRGMILLRYKKELDKIAKGEEKKVEMCFYKDGGHDWVLYLKLPE